MSEFDETMVENEEDFDAEIDDGFLEGVEEETDESEEESLDSVEEEEQAEPQQSQPVATEPGWIKQRVNKAVEKAVRETEARMQAMFDQQMAPIREKMMEDEAQALVRSRKVGDIETARELVRLRQGLQPQAEAPQPQYQPRNDRGQFAPAEDPGMTAKIDMLAHQADAIREKTGLDVIDVFASDPDIKDAVISGEMDFYELAEMMNQDRGKRPPAPMRSPNGASGQQHNAITTMSDEAFDRMEKKISQGARYSLK